VNTLRVYDSIAEAVGWTPLVRLHRSVEDLGCEVFAKPEFLNPMGSVKDRIARYMIREAMRSEGLEPGAVIVENSSGNTAMGLAMMAILEGMQCTMVVREQTSKEKLDCLRAVGVNLVLVDGTLPPEHAESNHKKAHQVFTATPGAYFPHQHNIDYLVAGIGTGGTICGVARYLKEQDPSIQVVAVDPVGSVFYEYFHHGAVSTPDSYLLEGLGDEEIIGCPEWELIDDMFRVTDKEAFLSARELARSEAILAGGSSGAALWAVRRLARGLDHPARIVTLFCDSGSRYLSTIYNDEWMKDHGFL